MLILVTISGVVGWAIYILFPARISSQKEEIITPEEIFFEMEKAQEKIDRLEKRKARKNGQEALDLEEEINQLETEISSQKKLLDFEFRQEALLGTWLYVHIPLSASFIVVVSVHAIMMFYL